MRDETEDEKRATTTTAPTTANTNLVAQTVQDWRVGPQAWLHAPFHHFLELQKRLFKGASPRRFPQEKRVVILAGFESGSLHVDEHAHALGDLRVEYQHEWVAGSVNRKFALQRSLHMTGGVWV